MTQLSSKCTRDGKDYAGKMNEQHCLERVAQCLGALWRFVMVASNPQARPPEPVHAPPANACTPALSVEHVTMDLLSDFALFHVEASLTQVCTQGVVPARAESTISLWPAGSAMTGLRVATGEKSWATAQRLAVDWQSETIGILPNRN